MYIGATSYTHLRAVGGTLHPTFWHACISLGLLQDDHEWIQCFCEAIVFATGGALRLLFATAVLTRKEFPIKLCFAMTVNKSQGQTLGIIGLDLRTAAFTHGQLNVAMSRVTNVANLAILYNSTSPVVTQNINKSNL